MKVPKIHIGPIALGVLRVIGAVGIITVAVCAPNALQVLAPFFKKKKYSAKQAVNRNIESLIRTGLVKKTVNQRGDVSLTLTKRGAWETFLRTEKKSNEWDGKWRIVVFDVPNKESKLRRELTRGMRLYGFERLQKSVWIYPYPCEKFVVLLKEHLEMSNNIIYLTAVHMDKEKEWRKKFKV